MQISSCSSLLIKVYYPLNDAISVGKFIRLSSHFNNDILNEVDMI